MPFSGYIQARTPSLQAGKLRHRAKIVQVSPAQDSTGGLNLSVDVLYADVWASVYALSGTDKFAAHEFISQVSHQVVIRYIGAAPPWVAGQSYKRYALIKDSNGNLQQAQNDGMSGASAPAWNTVQTGTTADGSGATVITWKNLGEAPAETGVKAKMQIWFRARQFQIEAVLNPDERNKALILLCIEINESAQQRQTPGTKMPNAGADIITVVDGGSF